MDKGYARKLTPEKAARKSRITWYLPHHPVFNVNKANKCRVVFDAAARFNGVSLNDQLYQGPDLTGSLVGVLIRFRQENICPNITNAGISMIGSRGGQIPHSTGEKVGQMPLYRPITYPKEGTVVKQLSQFEDRNKIILITNTVYKNQLPFSPREDFYGK